MSSLEDMLPASYEVTLLPLALAYVNFGLGLYLSIYIAILGPMAYALMCGLFITADLIDGIESKLLIAKVTFVLACLSPATFVLVWRYILS